MISGHLYSRFKRFIDIGFSLLFLILLFPLFSVIALLIKIDGTGGPVFSDAPRRVGRKGKKFFMYKFRSMVPEAHNRDSDDVMLDSLNKKSAKNDSRITWIGRVLRFWDLDELPQLINVFVGDMSTVGPRPYLPEEVESILRSEQKEFMKVLTVKPGITGLWQVSGRNNLTLRQRIRLDVEYVSRKSMWLDLWILVKTPLIVLSRKGAI